MKCNASTPATAFGRMCSIGALALALFAATNSSAQQQAASKDEQPSLPVVEDWSDAPADAEQAEHGWPARWRAEGRAAGLGTSGNGSADDPVIGAINASSSVRAYIHDLRVVDSVQQIDVRWPTTSGTANNDFGLISRYRPDEPGIEADTTAFYRAVVIPDDFSLRIQRVNSGGAVDLGVMPEPAGGKGKMRWTPTEWYTLKFRVRQSAPMQTELSIKFWPRGKPEPDDWALTVTHEVPMMQNVAGLVGIDARTSGGRRWFLANYSVRKP